MPSKELFLKGIPFYFVFSYRLLQKMKLCYVCIVHTQASASTGFNSQTAVNTAIRCTKKETEQKLVSTWAGTLRIAGLLRIRDFRIWIRLVRRHSIVTFIFNTNYSAYNGERSHSLVRLYFPGLMAASCCLEYC